MKRVLASVLLIIILGALPVFAKSTRITFKRGKTKAVATGKLYSYKSKAEYVIRVRAGQTLELTSNRRITLTVLNPSGEDVMDRDLGCNGKANISPTVAGDYKIIVTECMKADAWRGSFKLFVSAR